MWIGTRFGDLPHRMPDHPLHPGESTFTGWMLPPYHKRVYASSSMPVHPTIPVKRIRAASGLPPAPDQTLTVDLGAPRTVHVEQVDFADYTMRRTACRNLPVLRRPADPA